MTKDFFYEVDRIRERREEKDYWVYARSLLDNTQRIRNHYREWIQTELKELKFIADFLSSTTTGATKDKLLQQVKRLEEMDINTLRDAVAAIDTFTQQIENRRYTNLSILYSQYLNSISPLVDLVAELLNIRTLLDGMLDMLPRQDVT